MSNVWVIGAFANAVLTPRMDGLEALPRLRHASPGSRIVVLSGFGQDRLYATALELGASSYLEKGSVAEGAAARARAPFDGLA